MAKSNCPLCGGGNQRLRALGKNIFLKRCLSCHAEFLDPQPSDEVLQKEYQNYFQRRQTSQRHPKINYFKEVLRESGINLNSKRVLDVGTAEGDCILAISQSWPEAQLAALECNQEAANYLRDVNCKVDSRRIDEWLAQSPESLYDVIIMFDVLEHLRNPLETLKGLRRALAPRGKLICSFPNSDSISRRFLGRFWPQYKLEHLFYFSERSLKYFESQVNFKRLGCYALRKRLPLDYLLTVGSHFGPPLTQKATSVVRRVLPTILTKRSLRLGFGEWLWVVEKL